MPDYRRVTPVGRRPMWIELGRDTARAVVGFEVDVRGNRVGEHPFRVLQKGPELEVHLARMSPFKELEVADATQ